MRPIDLIYKARRGLRAVSRAPHQESLWLLSSALSCSLERIYLEKEDISPEKKRIFWDQIQRRKAGEPLERILREKIFFNKKFYVEPGVFIPRQETELLVEWVLQRAPKASEIKAVDFGAGAGALCLSLLSALPKSRFAAVEISAKAVLCLKKNSRALGAGHRLSILQKDISHLKRSDLTAALGKAPSLITANPPYIYPGDISLSREAFLFDPPLALFSDQGGMGHIRSWLEKALELLAPKGIYIFEFGWNQLEPVKKLLRRQTELSSYETHKDRLGHPRMAVCFKK